MRILWCTSSVGLGHAARDLAISRALKELNPNVTIDWIAADPALTHLLLNGIRPLPVSGEMRSLSEFVEAAFRGGRLRLTPKLILEEYRAVKENYRVISESVDLHGYDLVVLDEFWEVLASPFVEEKERPPVAFITDFLLYPYNMNPLDLLVAFAFNRGYRRRLELVDRGIYVGYPDELPQTRWLLMFGESVREWARRKMEFTGYIPSFQPGDIADAAEVREELGVEDGLLLLITVGGTSAGSTLIDVAVRAHSLLKKRLDRLYTVVVTGPRTLPPSISYEDVITLGHVPNLYRYLAAADCVVARGGLSTISDVAALGVPAVIVPMRGHYEQEHRAAYAARKFPNIHVLEDTECTPAALSSVIEGILKHRCKPEARSSMFVGQERAARYILELGVQGTLYS